MPRNSSGTFSLVAGNPVITGQIISSTVQNNTMNDVAQGLTQSLASTGVTTSTANQPMGGFRHTNVGNATTQGNYTSVTDVQNCSAVTLSSVTGTNDLIAVAPFTPVAYVAGQTWRFAVLTSNTGPVTINISSLGQVNVLKFGGTVLAAGDLAVGAVQEITFDGLEFQLVNARQGAGQGALTVNARSSNTAFGINDLGSANQFTSTFTQTFGPAATLGAGWYVDVQNIGVGVITFDANGTETFNTGNGALQTINIYPGEGYRIMSNGTGFDLFGRVAVVQLSAPVIASGAASVDLEAGFTDTELSAIEIRYVNGSVTSSIMAMRVKKFGAYVTGASYTTAVTYANGATAISLTGQTSGLVNGDNSLGAAQSGTITVLEPTSANGNMQISVMASSPTASPPKNNLAMIGNYESTGAPITGVRIFDQGGGGLSGKFSLYGIRG